jgi:hypothetical protein
MANKMNTKSIFVLLFTQSFLTSRAQPTTTGTYPPPVAIPTTPTEMANYPGPSIHPTEIQPTPTYVPVDQMSAQIAAIQSVSKKYNIPVDQNKIVNTEAKIRSSGCLGVVIPGVLHTNMISE